jgi:hypothetical protein
MSFAVFGPIPETRRNARRLLRHRLGDLRDAEGRQHAEGRLGADARDAQEQRERVELVALGESEQRQRVLTHDEVRVQKRLVACTQAARDVRRHRDGEPHAADLDNHRVGVGMQHDAAQGGDHGTTLEASSDVCSSDTHPREAAALRTAHRRGRLLRPRPCSLRRRQRRRPPHSPAVVGAPRRHA